MMTNPFCERLVEAMDNKACGMSILRDWEWFLGESLVSEHFQVHQLSHYLQCLREVLADFEIAQVAADLEHMWRKGYELGVLGRPVNYCHWATNDVVATRVALPFFKSGLNKVRSSAGKSALPLSMSFYAALYSVAPN